MNALTFNQITFNPVEQNDGQVWLTSSELAQALGYSDFRSVTKIYSRNADEFTEQMTTVVNLTTVRKTGSVEMNTRIFSLRGCHLVAMFAKTEIAKSFRKWVLDILDHVAGKKEVPQFSTIEERKPLRAAIAALVNKSGLSYSEAHRMVHARFGVEHLEELTSNQVIEAIEYVHGLILKAAAAKEPVKKEQISHKEMNEIRKLVNLVTHPFFFQESARYGVWHYLRELTQTPSPNLFNKEDMPIIHKEFKRLLKLADTLMTLRHEFDKAAIKQIIREGRAQENVLEHLREDFLQGIAKFENNQLKGNSLSLLNNLI